MSMFNISCMRRSKSLQESGCHLLGRDPIVVGKMSLFPKRTFKGVSQAQCWSYCYNASDQSHQVILVKDMSSHDSYTWLLLFFLRYSDASHIT